MPIRDQMKLNEELPVEIPFQAYVCQLSKLQVREKELTQAVAVRVLEASSNYH